MSKEEALAFLEKVKNDEDLQKRLKEAQDTESKLDIAKQEGFEFTEDEIKEVMSEMTEEDLDNVAGGKIGSSDMKVCGYEEKGGYKFPYFG